MGALALIIPLVSKLFDSLVPDPVARAKQQADFVAQITQIMATSDTQQAATNTEEAKSSMLFIAGWRPFIGWCGGVAVAWQFVLKPMLLAFSGFLPEHFTTAVLNAPILDDNFWSLIIGMLGLGAMRSFEKVKGVTK